MKVMNVGNTNCSNSRQQSFGMKLPGLTRSARKLILEDLNGFRMVSNGLEGLRTRNGDELMVKGKTGFFRRSTLYLSTTSTYNNTRISGIRVSKKQGESTFETPGVVTFYEKLLFALKQMNRCASGDRDLIS